VVLSILYFLNKVFEPYRLKIIGQIIAVGAFYGLLIQPLVKVYQFFKVPGRLGKVKKLRMYGTIAILVAAAAAICFIPLPSRVLAPLEVQARQAASVYADVPGILDKVLVRPGQQVTEGQALAELRDINIDLAITELTGRSNELRVELAGLGRVRFTDPRAPEQIKSVEEALTSVEEQLAKRKEERARLKLVAPRAGTVLPPPLVEDRPGAGNHLKTWSGSPFDKENLGALLEIGTKFCQIGDPKMLEARLVIDQGDVEFVAEGQRVEIMLTQSAEYVYVSHVEQVASEDLPVTPTHLSSMHGGPLASQMSADGTARPLSPVFQAIVPLPTDDPHGLLRLGLVGRAKIYTAPRTLIDRLYRYVSRTFNFEL
jgi:putative peptide zinc metalloprotease protein